MKPFAAAVLVLFAVGGCVSPASTATPAETDVLRWSADLFNGADRWQSAVEREYGKRPVVLSVHGGTGADGEWYAYPDAPRKPVPMSVVVRVLRDLYGPDRLIVLASCNEDGHRIEDRNVLYARKIVASWPNSLGLDILPWADTVGELERGGPEPTTKPATKPSR